MPFKRKRIRTEGVRSWIQSAVGQELTITDLTNRALHIISSHEQADKTKNIMAYILQVFARDVPKG